MQAHPTDSRSPFKRLIRYAFWLVILIVLPRLFAILRHRSLSRAAASQGMVQGSGDMDRFLQRTLDGAGDKKEALAWLSDGKHHSISQSSEQKIEDAEALQFVKDLYARGAVKVWVIDTETMAPDWEDARTLIIELPSDAAQRARIFQREAEVVRRESPEYSPTADQGQRLLFLRPKG